MIPWLLIAALALLAILITALMAIIAVGHQTEERPGTIDLTGIKPRAGYQWPSASRVRAEAASWDGFTSVRVVRKRDSSVVRDWWRPAPAEVIKIESDQVAEFLDHADERWQATKHLHWPGSINALQRADGCICPDRDTRVGSCPVHGAFPWELRKPGGHAA